MARNKVQFQRGLSDVEFERLYGTRKNVARRFLLALAGRLRVSGVRWLGALRARKACTVAVQREYRSNRRYDLPVMMPRLAWVAVRTPPMPYRLQKLAEDDG
jgi:hypothetical protein